jgi:thioredoxin-dependent peroxiredoxin
MSSEVETSLLVGSRSCKYSERFLDFARNDISFQQSLANLTLESSTSFGINPERHQMNKIRLTIFVFAMSGVAAIAAPETQQQPAAGKPAPDFSLTTGDGSQVSLKDYRGKWVVLYFYPKDFTGGCTIEAKNFERDRPKYEPLHAVILGVSVDTAQSHKDFCAKEGLNFKLLADPDAKVSTEYGSVMDHNGEKLAARNTFIINPKGEVAKVFVKVDPRTHSEEVMKALGELQKGS